MVFSSEEDILCPSAFKKNIYKCVWWSGDVDAASPFNWMRVWVVWIVIKNEKKKTNINDSKGRNPI
jgi:hypothetical protein